MIKDRISEENKMKEKKKGFICFMKNTLFLGRVDIKLEKIK